MRGRGNESRIVTALRLRKSTQNRHVPSFLGTSKTGAPHGEIEGRTHPFWISANDLVFDLVALRFREAVRLHVAGGGSVLEANGVSNRWVLLYPLGFRKHQGVVGHQGLDLVGEGRRIGCVVLLTGSGSHDHQAGRGQGRGVTPPSSSHQLAIRRGSYLLVINLGIKPLPIRYGVASRAPLVAVVSYGETLL